MSGIHCYDNLEGLLNTDLSYEAYKTEIDIVKQRIAAFSHHHEDRILKSLFIKYSKILIILQTIYPEYQI